MIISPPGIVYKQTVATRVAIVILLLIPIAILIIAGLNDGPPKPAPLAGAAAIAIAAVFLCIAIGRTQLSIHPEGVRRTSMFGMTEIEWKDVSEYRYRLMPVYGGGGLIGILLMAAASRGNGRAMNLNFRLIASDGRKLIITSNFKNAKDAIGRILGQIHPAMQKKVNESLDRGAVFGSITLSRRTIQWKNKEPIPLSDITSAEIRGSKLSIRRKDKMFEAISTGAHNVPNVLLLLETLESLGVAKNDAPVIDPMARVR